MSRRWGPLRSLLALSPVFVAGPLIAYWNHSNLPTPVTQPINNVTGLPQLSETNVLAVAQHLSEAIGYRTVGTKEHALGDAWMFEQAKSLKDHCDAVAITTGRALECEVWRQEGSGSHRFDMMGKRLYKTYRNLSNIIVRISDGTDEGKQHALLVNAHLDSTLPSPGAADDAISVGVMLESMRVLVNTPEWSPKHAIIFLFNNAEESLQDGSHLYATQHPTASTARAVINLEAAGTTGRELLFQATSEQMIDAYSHVPRPYGTVIANDIFSSGILLSDTDFRQFEEYMDISGLDMAIVGNSYLYHMRKDLVENIAPGVAQHMAENSLALIKYLSSAESPLPELANGYSKPRVAYMNYLGSMFVQYSFTTAKILYGALFLATVAYARMTYTPSPSAKNPEGFWAVQLQGWTAVSTSVIATILVPNLLAFLMRNVIKKSLSWFSNPVAPIGLYGPPALLGALASQYVSVDTVHEHTLWTSTLLMQTFATLAIQLMNIGSAAVIFMSAVPLFISLLLNPLLTSHPGEISMAAYIIGSFFPFLTGSILAIPTLEVFVPLTGRMGAGAPADHLIATLVAILGAQSLPLIIPLSHRFGKRALLRGIIFVTAITALSTAYFSARDPFDDMHQKRLFVIHMENITTHEQHLHLAAADGAPGLDELVADIAREFALPQVAPLSINMDDHNSDWESLYPFSAFLTPFKVPLAVSADYVSPWTTGESRLRVEAVNEVVDLVGGTRSLTVKITHPGLIWTAIAFDAHVLKWSLDDNPPNEFTRHHVKEASFYGTDVYSLDLTIRLTPMNPGGRLRINYMGLQEKGVWPAKKNVKEQGGVAMALFERLDGWLDEKTGGKVDALLMGCIGGVTVI